MSEPEPLSDSEQSVLRLWYSGHPEREHEHEDANHAYECESGIDYCWPQTVVRLLATLDAARQATVPVPLDDNALLYAVFAEMAERGWLMLPDGHGPATVRDVFVEARARLAQQEGTKP